MSTPAPDYREPWQPSCKFVDIAYTKTGTVAADSQLYRNRIIACINACAGMVDPAAEIEALKQVGIANAQMHLEAVDSAAEIAAMHKAIKEAHDAFNRLLLQDDPETGGIDTSPNATCPTCTSGTTPAKLDKGLCAYHAAHATLDKLKPFLP